MSETNNEFEYLTFDYKDSFVTVRKFKTGNIVPKETIRTCICCGEKINNCRAALLINNNYYIPNILLHNGCLEKHMDDQVKLCDEIAEKHSEYVKLKEIFK